MQPEVFYRRILHINHHSIIFLLHFSLGGSIYLVKDSDNAIVERLEVLSTSDVVSCTKTETETTNISVLSRVSQWLTQGSAW
jgi:hypothetical protein